MTTSNLELTRAYLRSFETRDGSNLAFYAPNVVQRELPNRLVPSGATRNLEHLRAGVEKGKQTVAEERYEVLELVATGDVVAAEVLWTARLNRPIGTLPAGAPMKAHLAMFITWQEGKIVSQRNYDCYEPF
jgi:ketosteroid isomerase-like protein